jgi:hypothetical protein
MLDGENIDWLICVDISCQARPSENSSVGPTHSILPESASAENLALEMHAPAVQHEEATADSALSSRRLRRSLGITEVAEIGGMDITIFAHATNTLCPRNSGSEHIHPNIHPRC